MAETDVAAMAARLARIRVVLINTTHPGNIGAVARAMKVMGLSSLHLVTPKVYPHADATARASGVAARSLRTSSLTWTAPSTGCASTARVSRA